MPKEKITTSVVTFDAELAQHYLDTYNTNNYRKPPKNLADHYAKLMREGKWYTSAATISISENNRLINGQNRLMGVIKSGVEVDIIVVRGAAEESVYVVDSHKPRQMHDHCGCDAYLVKAVKTLLRSIGLHNNKMLNNDVAFFKSHIDGQLGKFVKKMHSIYGRESGPFTSGGVRSALTLAVLNGELTQKSALDLFQKLIAFRKLAPKKDNPAYYAEPSSIRSAIQLQLDPLMSVLVDHLDKGKLPVWDSEKQRWTVQEYSNTREQSKHIMYAMSQAINRNTKDNTEFSPPMEAGVRQALGI